MDKKIIGVFLVSFLFFGTICASAFTIVENNVNTTDIIYVPGDYPTIQEAIDVASDGDTIRVREDTYEENIIIYKQLTLEVDGSGTPIIECYTDDVPVVKITADNVHLSGFKIQNYFRWWCIYIDNSNGNTITQNIVTHSVSPVTSPLGGICLKSSSNNIITDNAITDNGLSDGIRLDSSDHNTITGNTISNNGVGIGIGHRDSPSNFNEITDNKILDNHYGGIAITDSSNNNIERNTLSCNIMEGGGWVIKLWSASENTITGNTISQCIMHGIELVESSNHNTITDNFIAFCSEYGIRLESSNYNTVTDNTLKGNGKTIKEVNCEGNDISGNNAVTRFKLISRFSSFPFFGRVLEKIFQLLYL